MSAPYMELLFKNQSKIHVYLDKETFEEMKKETKGVGFD